jgi:hypothetical protein
MVPPVIVEDERKYAGAILTTLNAKVSMEGKEQR